MTPQFTPGPWQWYGSTYGDGRYFLATTHGGMVTVMAFKRSGTQGAQPMFPADGRLVPAKELVKFDVGDGKATGHTEAKADPSVYRFDFSEIDNPNARLIATAPELYEALSDAVELLQMAGFKPKPEHVAALAKARGEA